MPDDIHKSVESVADDSPDTDEKKLKRVCLYIVAEDKELRRTDEFMDQQLTMIHLINNTPGWKYEKIFMDIVREHTQFDKMIADCEAGKYDIIVRGNFMNEGNLIEQLESRGYHVTHSGRIGEK